MFIALDCVTLMHSKLQFNLACVLGHGFWWQPGLREPGQRGREGGWVGPRGLQV